MNLQLYLATNCHVNFVFSVKKVHTLGQCPYCSLGGDCLVAEDELEEEGAVDTGE